MLRRYHSSIIERGVCITKLAGYSLWRAGQKGNSSPCLIMIGPTQSRHFLNSVFLEEWHMIRKVVVFVNSQLITSIECVSYRRHVMSLILYFLLFKSKIPITPHREAHQYHFFPFVLHLYTSKNRNSFFSDLLIIYSSSWTMTIEFYGAQIEGFCTHENTKASSEKFRQFSILIWK